MSESQRTWYEGKIDVVMINNGIAGEDAHAFSLYYVSKQVTIKHSKRTK